VGTEIPKILSLGASLQFEIASETSIIEEATVQVNARTSIPDGARVAIDMINHENSAVSEFNEITFDPIFDVDNPLITLSLTAEPRPALALEVEVLEETEIEAALTFGTPNFNIFAKSGFSMLSLIKLDTAKTLITVLDEDEFCEDESATTGLKVNSAASFDMTLSVEESVDKEGHSFFNRKIVV
jgi:hypothetical protein